MLGVACAFLLSLAVVLVTWTSRPRISGLIYSAAVVPAEDAVQFHAWVKDNSALFVPVDHPEAEKETTAFLGPRTSVQFGYRYDYASNTIQEWPARLPHALEALRALASEHAGVTLTYFNQCIVNKYLPGQSILPHVDHPGFGEIIACFSLMAPKSESASIPIVVLTRGEQNVRLDVEDGSLYIMRGEARHLWKHSVQPVPSTRYSVTFRRVHE